jgi:hypothetical protein
MSKPRQMWVTGLMLSGLLSSTSCVAYTSFECDSEWEGLIGGTFRRSLAKCDIDGEQHTADNVVPMVGRFQCHDGEYTVRVEVPVSEPTTYRNPPVTITYEAPDADEACNLELTNLGVGRAQVDSDNHAEMTLSVTSTVTGGSDTCGERAGETIELMVQAECDATAESHR